MSDTVSLREYFEAILREREKALSVALEANESKVRTALESNEKRLAALNELRGDVATKTQYEAIKERMDRMEGRSGGFKDQWGWIIGAIGAMVAIGSLALHVR
jgi:hypothetical protein